MTTRYKAGSRVQQMWEKWEAKGTPAATAFGPSLNLAASTIKAWCRMWEREKEAGGPKPKAAKPDKPVKEGAPAKPKKVRLANMTDEEKEAAQAVFMKGNCRVVWTKRPVRLVARGEEQSEVRWLDTGSTQSIPTDQIIFK